MKEYFNNQERLEKKKKIKNVVRSAAITADTGAGGSGGNPVTDLRVDASSPSTTESSPPPSADMASTKPRLRRSRGGFELGRRTQKLQDWQAWLTCFYKDRLAPRITQMYAEYAENMRRQGKVPLIKFHYQRELAKEGVRDATEEERAMIEKVQSEGKLAMPVELMTADLSDEEKEHFFRNYQYQQ